MKLAHAPYSFGAVRLRLLADDDLRETLVWRNRDGVRQQFKSSAPLEWDAHHQWFVRYSEKADDLAFIVERVDSGAKVGQVAIYAIDDDKRAAEIGRFVVASEFQGQGLMREAIDALMRFAATQLALRSVYLDVIETNARARRLYESLGFAVARSTDGLIRMERSIDDYL
ncbi:GNAT family N-acetyltransferase [Caballeronia telluris]|uniref:GCN5-related N-acetyltransferase n=1 Tax=Caballeronia telluris TaxID=326475 RepID=A0A158IY57_9BURK|nr:GNAT family N-acetyltransferase [Caballeronia telluris]SAL61526.1 GCN5-related N-acetyltransferase [Caballeronia telluris]